MAQAYITYDVNNNGQSEVKQGMKELGYSDSWQSNSTTYYLPDTCLWKNNTELSTALKDIKSVIAKINIKRTIFNQVELERCIVVSADPWDGIPGKAQR